MDKKKPAIKVIESFVGGVYTVFFFFCRYLIDARWNKQLKKYLDMSGGGGAEAEEGVTNLEVDASSHPGRVDNGPLFKDSNSDDSEPGEIREHMMEELDYVVVPEEAWQVLIDEFGLTDGQEPIARKVVEHGMFVKHCKVEVYKNDFLLAENSDPSKTVKKKFSKSDTIGAYFYVL